MILRLSLRTRTMLLASLAVGSILSVDALLRLRTEREAGRAGLAERAALLATMQADALSVPLWNFDDDLVRTALDTLARDPDYADAEIARQGGPSMQGPAAPTADAQRALPSIEVVRPIRFVDHGQSRLLGQLRVSLRTGRLEASLMAEARQRVLSFVLLLAAVLFILGIAFRQLGRPLELLAGALARLASGDREVVIPALHREDEIGAVARGLQVFKDTMFQLTRTQGEYRAIFDHAALGIYCLDNQGSLVSVNAALMALIGYPTLAAFPSGGTSYGAPALYVDPNRPAELAALRLANGGYEAEVSELRRADGGTVWTTQTSRALRDAAGTLLGYVGTVEDITELRRRASEERLRIKAAVESAGDAMLIGDANGVPLFANRAFADILGHDLASLTEAGGIPSLIRDKTAGRQLAQAIKGGSCRIETELLTRLGRIVPMSVSVSAITGEEGEIVGSVTICANLSDRRAAAAQIEHMAHHDALTGLPNRAAFAGRLGAALSLARDKSSQTAVLCLDVDGFKEVDDTLGHAAGDELLQLVAARLSGMVRENDILARVGGDEFTIVQTQGNGPSDTETLAARVLAELSRPFQVRNTDLVVGVGIGIAMSPQNATDPEELIRFADLALYEAKAVGRNTAKRFLPEMDRVLQTRSSVERDLRLAIHDGSLDIHFQPQCRLLTGEIVGAEALLRWTHPQRGPVSPAEFIPIAEQTGQIGLLGEWVLRTACRTAASWPVELRVAVNISPVQFRLGDLVDQVRSALAESGLAPGRLELEITEGVMLHDTEGVLATLQAFKALGVRLAMDDFGTGYSSLSYLRRMPIDKIKIDQSFVRALGVEPAAEALVRSIIGIGRGLGIEANAEGVETEEQAKLLRHEGCYEAQGWHFGRPQPAALFAALLVGAQSRAA